MVVTQEHKAFVLETDRVGRVSIPVSILGPRLARSHDCLSKGYHRGPPTVEACVGGGGNGEHRMLQRCSFARGSLS